MSYLLSNNISGHQKKKRLDLGPSASESLKNKMVSDNDLSFTHTQHRHKHTYIDTFIYSKNLLVTLNKVAPSFCYLINEYVCVC